jgi:hypothetical protein
LSYTGKDLLLKFVEKESDSFNAIFDAVNGYALAHKRSLFRKDALQNGRIEPDDTDIDYKFADNIIIENDNVTFDLVLESTFTAQYKSKYDWEDESETIWLRLSCKMVIKDKLISFKVDEIDEYERKNYNKDTNQATASFVPIISREKFDAEAEGFLNKYYPQALKDPICLPIKEIAEKIMGLTIIDNMQLTKDLSIFGQICFASGEINTYDNEMKALVKTQVKRGTVFIDPNTYFLRCLGCANNTIAHEAFHWDRHRIYATVKSILIGQQTVAQRCPTAPKDNLIRNLLTNDEDWMEWQANGIAPKILMPKEATERKIKELVNKYNYITKASEELDSYQILIKIINELSEFYQVSKQAAKIRMIELGYPEATDVYNYDKDCLYYSKTISNINFLSEYKSNEEFRILFEMGLFRNVEGFFVIDTPTYWNYTDKGEYKLTNYAKENINECSLSFEYNIVELFEFNRERGILYKGQRQPRPVKIFSPKFNQASIDKALDVVPIYQKQIEAAKELGDETMAQMVVRYMKIKHWQNSIFEERTGLLSSTYRKIVNSPNCKLELPIVISICVGLGLPSAHARELLSKAGHILGKTNPEDIAYDAIISGGVGSDIISCNAFIEEIENINAGSQIRRLGSQSYNE